MHRQWKRSSVSWHLSTTLVSDEHLFDELDPLATVEPLHHSDKVNSGYDIHSSLIDSAQDLNDPCGLDCLTYKVCCTTLGHSPSEGPVLGSKKCSKENTIGKLLTFEFRQHVGALISCAALTYIGFVVDLVLRCHVLLQDDQFGTQCCQIQCRDQRSYHLLARLEYTSDYGPRLVAQVVGLSEVRTRVMAVEVRLTSRQPESAGKRDIACSMNVSDFGQSRCETVLDILGG